MPWDEREDDPVYAVLVNHEEQYSIWPAHRGLPLGWSAVGKQGTKQECLAYIEQVWTEHATAVAAQQARGAEEGGRRIVSPPASR
jgi:MbtH protein